MAKIDKLKIGKSYKGGATQKNPQACPAGTKWDKKKKKCVMSIKL